MDRSCPGGFRSVGTCRTLAPTQSSAPTERRPPSRGSWPQCVSNSWKSFLPMDRYQGVRLDLRAVAQTALSAVPPVAQPAGATSTATGTEGRAACDTASSGTTYEPTIPRSLSRRSEAVVGEGGSAHAEPGEGSPSGSWSQCAVREPWPLPMNHPGRITSPAAANAKRLVCGAVPAPLLIPP